MIALALFWACGAVDPLAPLPSDAAAALSTCDREAYPELATTCRVEAASRAAEQGRDDLAEQACKGVAAGLWNEECHFRAGEEFGHAGDLDHALSHCKRAGKYAAFCLTHVAWRAPANPVDVNDVSAVTAAWSAHVAQVDADLDGATPEFTAAARPLQDAQFWFGLYVGTGKAPAAAAKAAPEAAGPYARTAFAIEAVRLLAPGEKPVPSDIVDEVRAVWNGTRPTPTGDSLPPERRNGRYHPPMVLRAIGDLSTIPMYGGDQRLVAPSVDDDLTVATLQGLYFRPQTPADAFLPFLADKSPAVRYTAALMIRVTPSPTLDHDAILRQLAASDDPGLREEGEQGLAHREWEKFTGGPPAGRPGPPRP